MTTSREAPAGGKVIRSCAKPRCILCGAEGDVVYRGLSDRLYCAPGEWGFRRCPSPACGLLWLDPAPVEEDLGVAYGDYYTHSGPASSGSPSAAKRAYRFARDGYLERRFGYDGGSPSRLRKLAGLLLYMLPGRRAGLDFSVMYLPAAGGKRLLEVGCGRGDMVAWLSGLGWCAEGIDIDPVAVRVAREGGRNVRLGSMEDEVGMPGRFDAVVMSHLIEHVPDPRGLLQGAARVLNPGGAVSIVTPNTHSLGHGRFGPAWFSLDPPRHLNLFHPALLRQIVEDAGFREVRVFTVIRDANSLFAASRSIAATGRCTMAPPSGLPLALWAKALQLQECRELRRNPEAGEEIALVART